MGRLGKPGTTRVSKQILRRTQTTKKLPEVTAQ